MTVASYFPRYSIVDDLDAECRDFLTEHQGNGPHSINDIVDACAGLEVRARLLDAQGRVVGRVTADGIHLPIGDPPPSDAVTVIMGCGAPAEALYEDLSRELGDRLLPGATWHEDIGDCVYMRLSAAEADRLAEHIAGAWRPA